MALDVKVKIDLILPVPEASVTVGTPLILEENATTAVEYKEYSNLAEVIEAGFDITTKVYKTAQMMFMQDTPPEKVAICATSGTATAWLGVLTNTQKSWRQLVVITESSAPIAVSSIMMATETLDGKMYFASLPIDDTTSFTTTDISRSVLFYCSAQNETVIKGSYTMSSGAYIDSSYTGVQLISGEKYILTINGVSTKVTAATDLDYVKVTDGTVSVETKSGELMIEGVGTDTYDIEISLFTSGYEVAALVGATAGKTVGSFTYKNLILKGITPQDITDTQIEAIHSKGGMTFVTKAGDNVTSNSKTAGGDYIDIIDSEDYVISNLQYRTQKLLNQSDKIPYTDIGIAQLEAVAIDVMRSAYNMGIIGNNDDGTPGYEVRYGLRSEQSETDRAIRKYAGGTFRFILAGAVETVEITGEIII